jgi:putative membrane protein
MTRIAIRFLLAASLLTPVAGSALAEDTKPAPTKPAAAAVSDADLAVAAHVKDVNTMEIAMAKLVAKSKSKEVKAYAKALTTDHTKAQKDLDAWAKAKKVKIPAVTPTTEAEKAEAKEHEELMAKLKTLKGAELDAAYLQAMFDGHTKEVARIDTALGTVADAEFKTYLTALKPIVQKHADDAKTLQTNTASAPTTPTPTPPAAPAPTPKP